MKARFILQLVLCFDFFYPMSLCYCCLNFQNILQLYRNLGNICFIHDFVCPLDDTEISVSCALLHTMDLLVAFVHCRPKALMPDW